MTAQLLYVFILMIIGAGCLGYTFGARHTLTWRIEWIKLEHDHARKEGREPRNIREFEESTKAALGTCPAAMKQAPISPYSPR